MHDGLLCAAKFRGEIRAYCEADIVRLMAGSTVLAENLLTGKSVAFAGQGIGELFDRIRLGGPYFCEYGFRPLGQTATGLLQCGSLNGTQDRWWQLLFFQGSDNGWEIIFPRKHRIEDGSANGRSATCVMG